MFSARQIEETIPQDVVDIYSDMEMDMLLACAAFSVAIEGMDYAAKMYALNELQAELQAIVSKYWTGTQKELANTMRNSLLKSMAATEVTYIAGVTAGKLLPAVAVSDSLIMRRIIDNAIKETILRFSKVNTTAVNVTISTLQEAFLMNLGGRMALQQAVVSAVEDMAASGITAATFPSGRSIQMASFVRMVIRTSTANTARELAFARAQEYGVDLIQVSAHAGARPLCEPFQGRIFSLSGKTEKYPPFSSTSYGEVAGLFGINCGHFFDPFIEGVDRQPTAEEIDPAGAGSDKGNAQMYRESQMQRYNERMIRSWKRRAEVSKVQTGDNTFELHKVREWQARQRSFLAQADRTRRYYREAI